MKTHAPPGILSVWRAMHLSLLTCIGLSTASLWAAPTITTQPANATCAVGSPASICVTATSSGGPLTYQWRQNGTDISGATGSCYNPSSVQKTDAGLYTCLVSDNNGSTLSSSAILFLDRIVAYFDDFNSGGLTFGQWVAFPSYALLEVNPSDMTRTDHDGTPTAYIRHNGKKMYHQIAPIAMTGNHFRLSAYIYDDDNVGYTDGYIEFRGYSGAFGSTLNQLLALGKYTPTYTSTDPVTYQRRYTSGTGAAWANTSATPSGGWHKFTIDVNNGTFTSYIGDDVGEPFTQINQVTTATAATLNFITVGGAGSASTMWGDSWADDLSFEIFTSGNPINPAFGTQPVAATKSANVNDSVTFTAAAAAPYGSSNPGGDALAYQWLKNGAAISGATTTSYAIANPQLSDAGTYACVAYYTGGSVKSADAALAVSILPPTVVSQNPAGSPPDYAVTPGTAANFSVTARASNPINYRWYKGTPPGGTPLSDTGNASGALTASLTLNPVSTADNGNYYCHLSNGDGSTNSAAVNLVVPSCPVISTQPSSVTNGVGSNVTFTVSAAGSSLSYVWKKNGSPVSNGAKYSGATTDTLGVANLVDVDAGTYTCTIGASGCASVTTDPKTLTVVHQPTGVTVSPAYQQGSIGGTASFAASVASGDSPFTYQWQYNGSPISGATASTYSFSPSTNTDSGTYTCVVANPGGSASGFGTLLVPFAWADDFESYSINPLDKNQAGNSAPNGSGNPWWGTGGSNLRVINFEYATPHNQNQSSNTKMVRSAYAALGPGYTGQDLDLELINVAYRFNGGNPFYGDFMCEWWFYDQYGTSGTVDTNGTIRRIDYNDEVSLCYYADNLPTDQDYNGISPSAPVSLSQRLSIGACSANGTLDDMKYQVAIMGVSDGVTWGMNQWLPGQTAAYDVSAQYFNTPLTRSIGWHHARIVVGPADPSTHIATVQYFIDDMNNAQVTKTMVDGYVGVNALEVTTSWEASSANPGFTSAMGYFDDFGFQSSGMEPWIVQQPASLAVATGQPATLSVVAACSSYQWKKNGGTVGGATGSSYTIASASAGDAASYTCVVTGAAGSLESAPAVLNVINGTYGGGTGLQGAYFSDTTLTTLNATRLDPTVNFDGGAGNNFPGANVGPSNFGARWIGSIQPGFSETYTFYTSSDDGVRLWVGGSLIIDHWVGQAAREWSGSIALNAGQTYPITLEYYQGTGGDIVNLKWQSAHTAKDIVPTSALYPAWLTCQASGTAMELSWWPPFSLTWATNVLGPYQDVPGAPTSPYTNSIGPGPQRFFRLRY